MVMFDRSEGTFLARYLALLPRPFLMLPGVFTDTVHGIYNSQEVSSPSTFDTAFPSIAFSIPATEDTSETFKSQCLNETQW